MPRSTVLSISSQVAYGHVGNSVSILALQTLGCSVIDIPTVILSSHPGHGPAAGIEISAEKIDEFLNTLDRQGRLEKVDAVISGYMKSPQQVLSVKRSVAMIRRKNPAAIFCCDPIIGDAGPGIYVPGAVAAAIKAELIPLSNIITPNLFEFQFLTGARPVERFECIKLAREAFKADVLITSMPMNESSHWGNLLICRDRAWVCTAARHARVPNGTGDLLAALFVGHYLHTHSYKKALSYACGQLNSVLTKSLEDGGDELSLSPLMKAPAVLNFPDAQLV